MPHHAHQQRLLTHMLRIFRFICIFCVIIFIYESPTASAQTSPWVSRVDPILLTQPATRDQEFLITLVEQSDLSAADNLPTKTEKGRYVYEHLSAVADRTQAPLLKFLESQRVEHRSYWVANLIWARGDLALIQTLASRADVAYIYANPWVSLDPPLPASLEVIPSSINGIEWNVLKVRAPDVWAEGYTGQGVVIGGQDTGYDWTHSALKIQYRGWDAGAGADHNYNWHDAIHTGSSSCGVDSPEPCDDYPSSHGTHTMGTMVGDDGAGNQIGVAPGARWIGCRNMRSGEGSPVTYTECFQWFIAPTDLAGQNPRPDLAPDVVNNSWACPDSEGCTEPDILRLVVEAVRAAGILTVQAAGNYGPACSSVRYPAAIYAASLSVGALKATDDIAGFSSRGPVTVDGSNRLKPNLSAPGVSIRSSVRGSGYALSSGTSMASPHVAGVAALLISAYPALRGQIDDLQELLEGSAVPLQTSETCGGTAGQVPNHTFGWGRVDAFNAFQSRAPRAYYFPLVLYLRACAPSSTLLGRIPNGISQGVEPFAAQFLAQFLPTCPHSP